jgi:hypothetical protein
MDNLGVRIDFLEFMPAHTDDGQNITPKITIRGSKRIRSRSWSSTLQ